MGKLSEVQCHEIALTAGGQGIPGSKRWCRGPSGSYCGPSGVRGGRAEPVITEEREGGSGFRPRGGEEQWRAKRWRRPASLHWGFWAAPQPGLGDTEEDPTPIGEPTSATFSPGESHRQLPGGGGSCCSSDLPRCTALCGSGSCGVFRLLFCL